MVFPSTRAVGEPRVAARGCRDGNLNITCSQLDGRDRIIDALGKMVFVFNRKWKLFFSILLPSSLAALDIAELTKTS